MRLFAGDIIVYNTNSNINKLQKDLRSLEKWEENWDMEFYPAKFQHISFSRKPSPSQQNLTLHNMEIPKSDDVKYMYLKVTVDSKYPNIFPTLQPKETALSASYTEM